MSNGLVYRYNVNVGNTSAPPIPRSSEWAAKYQATEEEPLINLAQGVPGAPPPPELQLRLAQSAGDPSTTTYGDLRGDLGLRTEFARDINESYGGNISVEDVVLTAGANLAFYAAMVTLAQTGDEVILPSPWYFNNEMVLTQLGIRTMPLRCLPPHFTPDVEQCEELMTDKTRCIVLVSPNNPTGAIYSAELIQKFADLAQRRGVALLLDETYREFLEHRAHKLFTDPNWANYLIHIFSFSKSYAIPGHRLGALVSSPVFLAQLNKTLDCLQICPARPAQRAIEWAIKGTKNNRIETRNELAARQNLFRDLLQQVQGWEVAVQGGYFAYVQHPFAGSASELVAARLAEFVGVICLPGTFFSPAMVNAQEDRFLRFSVANVSQETLKLIPNRLRKLNEIWPTFK